MYPSGRYTGKFLLQGHLAIQPVMPLLLVAHVTGVAASIQVCWLVHKETDKHLGPRMARLVPDFAGQVCLPVQAVE